MNIATLRECAERQKDSVLKCKVVGLEQTSTILMNEWQYRNELKAMHVPEFYWCLTLRRC